MYSQLFKLYNSRISYSIIKETAKNYSKLSSKVRVVNEQSENQLEYIDSIIKKYKGTLLYNSVIEDIGIELGHHRNKLIIKETERKKNLIRHQIQLIEPLPLSLKYVTDLPTSKVNKEDGELKIDSRIVSFPYQSKEINSVSYVEEPTEEIRKQLTPEEEVNLKYEKLKEMHNWMMNYDNYTQVEEEEIDHDNWKINYGTPDPRTDVSNVPCGGCGAYLHCKDTAIPGYIPSEIFKNHKFKGGANLEAIICQRCYFLKHYNMALQVKVSSEDYPKVLQRISKQQALVLLMVDLMDFPCSIWPGIADIFGPKTPIIIVGNKIDLLPRDDDKFLQNIKTTLLDYCKISGFGTSNIQNIALISAKTGFGVEDLITILQASWKFHGDVYLVGCTNVGKSSLFNALLQSDYCKIQSSDLIQRATTSLWPGTTLNLLKFPITKPSAHRMELRNARLKTARKLEAEEQKLRRQQLKTYNTPKYATLIGHIGRSYTLPVKEEGDLFGVSPNSNASGKAKMGINEKDPEFVLSRWCFDTPGVVQTDQIINILTADELMLTLPKQIIRPVTFCVQPGNSLFIAGLGRLDYLKGNISIRLTVFRSNSLPLTICKSEMADELYQNLLGTDLLAVPINVSDRLTKWPGLQKAKTFSVIGVNSHISSKDVVLSSAGWVAINIREGEECLFEAWTPEKRGCYLRECLLPKAVQLRGRRKRYTPVYGKHKFI